MGGFASLDNDTHIKGFFLLINLQSTVIEIWGSSQSSDIKTFKIRSMEVCRS